LYLFFSPNRSINLFCKSLTTLKTIFYKILLCLVCLDVVAQSGKPLPAPVNTIKYSELTPSVSADGKSLIFESDRQGTWKIYECRRLPSGGWSPPVAIITAGDAQRRSTPVVSYDGSTIIYSLAAQSESNSDIYIATKTTQNGVAWGKSQKLSAAINTSAEELFPSLSADGKRLYFARGTSQQGKQGCYKIWVSEKDASGNWQSATMLPAPVNVDCETAPRILADNQTLIFSSVRAGGRGNFDLYQSRLGADGTWSQPVSLDFLNTPDNDQAISVPLCGEAVFYNANADIFTGALPSQYRPLTTYTLQGVIQDDKTTVPIASVNVSITDQTSGKVVIQTKSSDDGTYTAVVPSSGRYVIEGTKAGYKKGTFTLGKLNNMDCSVVGRDLQLIPEEKPVAETPTPTPTPPLAHEPRKADIQEEAPKPTIETKVIAPPKDVPVDWVVMDSQTNKQLTNIEFSVVDKTGKKINAERLPESAAMRSTLRLSEEYSIEIKAKGFKPIRASERIDNWKMGSDPILRTFRMIPAETDFVASFTDKETNGKIPNVKVIITDITNNQNVQVDYNIDKDKFTSSFRPGIRYKVVAKADGYDSFEKIYESTFEEAHVLNAALNRKVLPPVFFTALDAKSEKPIGAKINVLAEKTNRKFSGETSVAKPKFDLKLSAEERSSLTVEVVAEGYKTVQKNFTIDSNEKPEKLDYTISLERAFFSLPVKVIDKATNQATTYVELKIIDQKTDKEVDVTKANDGSLSVGLRPDGRYVAEVKANGYEDYRENIPRVVENNDIILKLTRQKSIENSVLLSAIDTTNGKPLDALFKVYSTKTRQSFTGRTSKDNPDFKVNIAGEDVLTIETFALGYQIRNTEVKVKEKSGKVFEKVKLQRDFSTLTLKAINVETGQQIMNANFTVLEGKTRRPLVAVATSKTGIFSANVKPGEDYIIEVKTADFLPHDEKIKATYDDLDKEIKINPIHNVKISVYAIDELTKKTIPGYFKISETNGKVVFEGRSDLVKQRLPVLLVDKTDYKIDVESQGYKMYEGKFTADYSSMGNKDLAIPFWLQKLIYPYSFKASDVQTKKAVKIASLNIKEEKTSRIIDTRTSQTGEFIAELAADVLYTLNIEADGYVPYEERIDPKELAAKFKFLKDAQMTQSKKPKPNVPAPAPITLDATPTADLEVGKSFVLQNLYFDQSSYILKAESYPELIKLADLLKKNPKVRIEIAGHTDGIGDQRLNEYLSENRAKVIANFLSDKGIDMKRLVPKGYGGSKPISTNDNEENRRKNRRVEFVVIK
jgi:outer membrane protein OmpA-like peptidoglycan-associated protein